MEHPESAFTESPYLEHPYVDDADEAPGQDQVEPETHAPTAPRPQAPAGPPPAHLLGPRQPERPPPVAMRGGPTIVSIFIGSPMEKEIEEVYDSVVTRVSERGTVKAHCIFNDEIFFRMATDKQAQRVHQRTEGVQIMNSTVTLRSTIGRQSDPSKHINILRRTCSETFIATKADKHTNRNEMDLKT